MQPLWAEIITEASSGQDDRRRAPRRTLRLGVPTYLEHHSCPAMIRNLSETGLMMQTSAELHVGDHFEVELPEAGRIGARVVWGRDDCFGCQFDKPASKAAISASLLMAEPSLGEDEETAAPEYALLETAEVQQARHLTADTQASVLLLLTAILRLLLAFVLLAALLFTDRI